MELVLSLHEQHSPLGLKLAEHFTARLQTLREANDKSMLESERAILIAKIAEAKALVKLLTKDPITVAPE
jgi:hypothetical protein